MSVPEQFPQRPMDAGGSVAPPQQARNRDSMALVVVAVVIAGMLYFGFHMARRSSTANRPGMAGSRTAPDFTLESLDGSQVRLSDLRGKAVLVNFWATWCEPCKEETPWLVELQSQYGPQGLQILGVAMDDDGKKAVEPWVKKQKFDVDARLEPWTHPLASGN